MADSKKVRLIKAWMTKNMGIKGLHLHIAVQIGKFIEVAKMDAWGKNVYQKLVSTKIFPPEICDRGLPAICAFIDAMPSGYDFLREIAITEAMNLEEK